VIGYLCSVPLPGQVVPEWAGAGTARAERIYSGFEDIYDQGAEPFPCEEQQQTLYRGRWAFDLGEFDSIVDATLNFDVAQSIAENGGVKQPNPPVSNATTLGMSLEQAPDQMVHIFGISTTQSRCHRAGRS